MNIPRGRLLKMYFACVLLENRNHEPKQFKVRGFTTGSDPAEPAAEPDEYSEVLVSAAVPLLCIRSLFP